MIRRLNLTLGRRLNLKLAAAKPKIKNLLNARLFAWQNLGIVFSDLVSTGDTEVNASVSDEGGDIGCGEEDEGDVEILDEGNV